MDLTFWTELGKVVVLLWVTFAVTWLCIYKDKR